MLFALQALLVSSLLSAVSANFKLSIGGSTFNAGSDSLKVSWEDDDVTPSIDGYDKATFLLCTYGASRNAFSCDITLGSEVDISDATEQEFELSDIKASGGSGSYVLQMTAIKSAPVYVINYSGWIQITGMTGGGTANTGTTPGKQVVGDTSGQNSALGTLTSGTIPSEYQNLASNWMTPYTYQFGQTRYAPFQSTPNTSVTAPLTFTRRYPTSAYSAFTTYLFTALPVTTVTPSPSVTITLQPNYAETIPVKYSGRAASKVTASAVWRQRRWVD